MTLKSSLLVHLKNTLQWTALSYPSAILNFIKDKKLVICDDITLENNILSIRFDDITIKYRLIWKESGNNCVLIDINETN